MSTAAFSGRSQKRLRPGNDNANMMTLITRSERVTSPASAAATAIKVLRIKPPRYPGRRTLAASKPLTDQRSFTKARRSRDEGQFAVQAFIQPLDQVGSEDNILAERRNVKLCG